LIIEIRQRFAAALSPQSRSLALLRITPARSAIPGFAASRLAIELRAPASLKPWVAFHGHPSNACVGPMASRSRRRSDI
jgi:hypothetical protein